MGPVLEPNTNAHRLLFAVTPVAQSFGKIVGASRTVSNRESRALLKGTANCGEDLKPVLTAPGRMAHGPRAGTGDSACRS